MVYTGYIGIQLECKKSPKKVTHNLRTPHNLPRWFYSYSVFYYVIWFNGKVNRAAVCNFYRCGIEPCTRENIFYFFCHKTHFPLLGKNKFPLGVDSSVEYIFESKSPLVVRMGLAARSCGSGNGQSPSNSMCTPGQLSQIPVLQASSSKYLYSRPALTNTCTQGQLSQIPVLQASSHKYL